MHRFHLYITVLISIITLPVSAFAEVATDTVLPDSQGSDLAVMVNSDNLYIDLPSVDYNQLLKKIKSTRDYLTGQKQKYSKYLDKNQLNANDAVITAVLPGGLLYAAIRKSNLNQAESNLVEIKALITDLSSDLMIVEARVNRLTVAQLQ